jgi:hypothetical protein
LSLRGSTRAAERAAEAGFEGHIVKPVGSGDLAGLLDGS